MRGNLPKRQSPQGLFTALVVGLALLLTQVLSGAQFVDSALERAEFYAGVCTSADPQCSTDGGQLSLGRCPAHTINLGVHLMGVLPVVQAAVAAPARAPQSAVVGVLKLEPSATEVYHPPKA